MELYKKYRPDDISGIVGQPEAVNVVGGWIKAGNIPHSIMFEGPTGVGKTTFARCLAKQLGATDVLNYREMNVSVDRGIAMVEDLIEDVSSNLFGGNRVWVLDELHGVSKSAQNSLLKVLEESPSYAYFVFCTTDPQKIIPALLNRCSRISLRAIPATRIEQLVLDVASKEGRDIPVEVARGISLKTEGSARSALVLLEQVLAVSDPDAMQAIVSQASFDNFNDPSIQEFWKVLFSYRPVGWSEVVASFDKLTESEETIRRITLRALATRLRRYRGGIPMDKLADMMRIFQFGLEESGRDGLLLMVYDAWQIMRR